MPEAEWVMNLQAFVHSVQDCFVHPENIALESPQILAKFKEQDPGTGEFIFRPICKYSDLKTKIILALSYHYILDNFDRYFHANMLFMRATQRVNINEYKVLDAIDLVSNYRRRNNDYQIYVGECDIKKFYDILESRRHT